jgi:hypothetical protein
MDKLSPTGQFKFKDKICMQLQSYLKCATHTIDRYNRSSGHLVLRIGLLGNEVCIFKAFCRPTGPPNIQMIWPAGSHCNNPWFSMFDTTLVRELNAALQS